MKQAWRNRWLSSLNELTSFELQEKSWLNVNNENPHWSYVEFISCYFDDLLFNHEYQYFLENGYLTKQEYEVIKNWHEALSEYKEPDEDPYNHVAILNDPQWINIVTTGKKTKSELAKLLNDTERSILLEIKTIA